MRIGSPGIPKESQLDDLKRGVPFLIPRFRSKSSSESRSQSRVGRSQVLMGTVRRLLADSTGRDSPTPGESDAATLCFESDSRYGHEFRPLESGGHKTPSDVQRVPKLRCSKVVLNPYLGLHKKKALCGGFPGMEDWPSLHF